MRNIRKHDDGSLDYYPETPINKLELEKMYQEKGLAQLQECINVLKLAELNRVATIERIDESIVTKKKYSAYKTRVECEK